MKPLLIITAAALLAGCATQPPTQPPTQITQSTTRLLYSSKFKISLPTSFMAKATVFYSDELGVKSSLGKVFSGQIVSNEKDNLPESFDIRLYPEYLFKIRPTTDLSDDLAISFDNTTSEINYSYDLNSLEIKKENTQTIYSLCKLNECFAIVVKNDFNEHIFYAHTQGIGRTELTTILNGKQLL